VASAGARVSISSHDEIAPNGRNSSDNPLSTRIGYTPC